MDRHGIDLIIVGAGPAGLSTAMHLVKLDPAWRQRLVVIEKAVHPRPKLCAGGVTRFGLRALRSLGFPLPLPLPQVEVHHARIVYQGRAIDVRGEPLFVVFHRSELDGYLLREARERGIVIQEGEAVRHVTVGPEAVQVQTSRGEYQARAVVGADGSLGVVRRALGGRASPKRVARLLEYRLPAPESSPLFQRRQAIFDFSFLQRDLQGYCWNFPSRVDGVATFNLGIYDSRFARRRPRADLPRLLRASRPALGAPEGDGDVAGHPLRWFSPFGQFAGERVILVGDAAGVEGLFGEGIGPSLGYGRVAAAAIQHAFGSQDFSFRGYRGRVLRSAVGRYLLLRWLGAWLIYTLGGRKGLVHTLWTGFQFLAKILRAGAL